MDMSNTTYAILSRISYKLHRFKTECRWFLLEIFCKAVDKIKCTSLDSRENPVIKAGTFYSRR